MTSVLLRRLAIPALLLCACAYPVWANVSWAGDTPMTADQASQLKAYMAKIPANLKPTRLKPATSIAPSVDGVDSAVEAAITLSNSAQTISPAKGDPDTVIAANPRSLLAMLAAPETTPGSLTRGLGTGLGVQPVPELSHQAAEAIIAAMKTPPHRTADDAAALAAALTTTPAPSDPALEERIILARAVLQVDGTEALVRRYVDTAYKAAIVGELVKHIDVSKLSETDKYRLTAILTVAMTELADKVVLLNARMQAENLTKAELTQLLAAYDIDPQRKLTALRLNDDGKVDRSAELDIRLAQYQMVKMFESVP